MNKLERQKKAKELRKHKDLVQTYYNSIVDNTYIEDPVDVLTFLSDPYYLGEATRGGADIFPVWKDALVKMFEMQEKYIVVLTGSTGCLGSDVKIKLLDGRSLTIPEIMKERNTGIQHWTYSYDIETDKIVPGKVVDALLSNRNVDTLKVNYMYSKSSFFINE
jgi:hypothetical protein